MVCEQEIYGAQIYLRTIQPSDCGAAYLSWMRHKETNQYMETRWVEQTEETIKSFVNNIILSNDSILFAIIEKDTRTHIGNIKIGPINVHNCWADISYFIGDMSARKKGYATEAVKLICEFGFSELHLHRIQAGLVEGNTSSEKVLQKNGFQLEGRLSEKCLVETGEYRAHLIYGLVAPKSI